MSITVVTGPPCSGKTRYVNEHRSDGAVVVDLDAIARALGYPAEHVTWNDQHPAVTAARGVRSHMVGLVQRRLYSESWVIDATPHPTTLRIFERAGARVVRLDPGLDECRRRAIADGRDQSTLERIDAWYRSRGAAAGPDALAVFGSRADKIQRRA